MHCSPAGDFIGALQVDIYLSLTPGLVLLIAGHPVNRSQQDDGLAESFKA